MFCTAQLILWNDPINLGKILELPEIVHRTLICTSTFPYDVFLQGWDILVLDYISYYEERV